MHLYKIIDYFVKISLKEELGENWNKFRRLKSDYGEEGFSLKSIEFHELNRDIKYVVLRKNIECIIQSNGKWMVIVDGYSVAYVQAADNEIYNKFLCYLFYTHAVQRHIIQFHSSLINFRGYGLMFLGPSGIGKTTQAELWNQYRDALIINGDIVFVQETEEAFFGWGTPWHGSSPYCENTNVPVGALIILKQAPENSIRKLEGFEKVTAVSNSVFYPRWLENGMELCLETLDHLLSKLPVYELSCRPDEEAVELTEKTIFGREN